MSRKQQFSDKTSLFQDRKKQHQKKNIINLDSQDDTEKFIDEIKGLKALPQQNNFSQNRKQSKQMTSFELDKQIVNDLCLICMEENLKQGRFVLDCKHQMCQICYKYWIMVTTRCPFCQKFSNSILKIFNQISRLERLIPQNHVNGCKICKSNRNVHEMYLCDICQQGCIHSYCEPNLDLENSEVSWICDQCISKGFQNVNSENQSINQYQFDDFVVPDDEMSDEPIQKAKNKRYQTNSNNTEEVLRNAKKKLKMQKQLNKNEKKPNKKEKSNKNHK